MLPHLPGVPHLHVNRPLVTALVKLLVSFNGLFVMMSSIEGVTHGKDLPHTRRLTTGALQSTVVINKSLKEFHALSGFDSSSMIIPWDTI